MSSIIDKIRKLLAVTTERGASEAEAAFAMKKAAELMAEHNIRESDISTGPNHTEIEQGVWHDYSGDLWVWQLGVAIARMYSCRYVRSTAGRYAFVGRHDNIEACEVTMEWVQQQVEALYKQALRQFQGTLNKRGRAELRKTFKVACVAGISMRIDQLMGDIPSHHALVVIRADVEEFLGDIPTTKRNWGKSGIGTGMGYAASRQVELNRKINDC